MWEHYPEEENTWKLVSAIQHLYKLINIFYKEHLEKPIVNSPPISSAPSRTTPSRPIKAIATKPKCGHLTQNGGFSKDARKIWIVCPTSFSASSIASKIFCKPLIFFSFFFWYKEIFSAQSSAHPSELGADISVDFCYYFLTKFGGFLLLNHLSFPRQFHQGFRSFFLSWLKSRFFLFDEKGFFIIYSYSSHS